MSELSIRMTRTTITCPKHGEIETLERHPSCRLCSDEERETRAEQQRHERAAEVQRNRLKAAFSLSGLVGRFETATFENFEASEPKHIAARNAAREFADGVRDLAAGVTNSVWRTLWLLGPPGTGKTHLASSIVHHVIVQHFPLSAAIRTVCEIVAEHRQLWDRDLREKRREFNEHFVRGSDHLAWIPASTDDLVEWLGNRSLLAIDDIGASRLNDAELELLFNVVDLRYRMRRPTVITSNLPVSDLAAQIGSRLADRLQENASIVACAWPSQRKGPLNRQ